MVDVNIFKTIDDKISLAQILIAGVAVLKPDTFHTGRFCSQDSIS